MKKHVMAITYKPKIEPVKDGRCTQTIRKGRRFTVGDSVLIHGWEGRPYRSKWSWRMRVIITMAAPIVIHNEGISGVNRYGNIGAICHWWGNYCKTLAIEDSIEPATGEELKNVLFGLNGEPTESEQYQIIRWEYTTKTIGKV